MRNAYCCKECGFMSTLRGEYVKINGRMLCVCCVDTLIEEEQ